MIVDPIPSFNDQPFSASKWSLSPTCIRAISRPETDYFNRSRIAWVGFIGHSWNY